MVAKPVGPVALTLARGVPQTGRTRIGRAARVERRSTACWGRGRRAGVAGLILFAATLQAAPAARAQAIYRCDDGRGGVLYTDAPCKQGAALDLAPGKANPEAIARLERERQAFEQRQRARDARAEREEQASRAEREAERQRLHAAALAEQRMAEQNAMNSAWWGWYPAWPIAPTPPRPPRPPRPEPVPPSGTLPASPRVPGR